MKRRSSKVETHNIEKLLKHFVAISAHLDQPASGLGVGVSVGVHEPGAQTYDERHEDDDDDDDHCQRTCRQTAVYERRRNILQVKCFMVVAELLYMYFVKPETLVV